MAIFEKECAQVALTPAQYGVLYTLGYAPGIDQSTLSRALGLDRVTILRVAKGLEGRGLIVRQPGRITLSLPKSRLFELLFLRAPHRGLIRIFGR